MAAHAPPPAAPSSTHASRVLSLSSSSPLWASFPPPYLPWDASLGDFNPRFEHIVLPLLPFLPLLFSLRASWEAASSPRRPLAPLDRRRTVILLALALLLGLPLLVDLLAAASVLSWHQPLDSDQACMVASQALFFLLFLVLLLYEARRRLPESGALKLALSTAAASQLLCMQTAIRLSVKNRAWGLWESLQTAASLLIGLLTWNYCLLKRPTERRRGTRISPFRVRDASASTGNSSFVFHDTRQTRWRFARRDDDARAAPLLSDEESWDSEAGGEAEVYVHPAGGGKALLPEAQASLWEKLSFSWLSPLVAKGRKQPLTQEDLYTLPACQKTKVLADTLEVAWQAEEERSRSPLASSAAFPLSLFRQRDHPSLFRVLVRCYGWRCVLPAFLKLTYDLLQFVGPLMLHQIISFLSRDVDGDMSPVTEGVFYAAVLLLSSLLQSFILHQYFHLQMKLGMDVRVSVAALIYRKALRLSPGAHTNRPDQSEAAMSAGKVVNLMSVDTQRLQDLMLYLHILWSGPLQILLALLLLFRHVGVAALGGVLVMLVGIPTTGYVSRRIKLLQSRVMAARDARGKVTNEFLSAMKVIKLYAWEGSFSACVSRLRSQELRLLWRYQVTNNWMRLQWLGMPLAVSSTTFGLYVWRHGALDPATVFTALALFNALGFPMQMVPATVNNSAEASASLKRIQDFLDVPERPGLSLSLSGAARHGLIDVGEAKTADSAAGGSSGGAGGEAKKRTVKDGEARKATDTDDGQPALPPSLPKGMLAIDVKECDVVWANGDTLFRGLKFQCRAGSLTAVIGPTGAGKSGLLSTLLGDTTASPVAASRGGGSISLLPETSPVSVVGRVAYVSQEPWIRNASLRANILFGSPFLPEWYNCVLDCCALRPDLALLPAGDETEIGERGVNLSGGQKQRVALARAVYAQADVYLLDDCFSAVDAHVAVHLFSNCVRGLLRSRTVLLVTHKLGLALPAADQILFLGNKKILFDGSLETLQKLPEFQSFSLQEEREEAARQRQVDEEQKDGDAVSHTLSSRRRDQASLSLAPPGRDKKAAPRDARAAENSDEEATAMNSNERERDSAPGAAVQIEETAEPQSHARRGALIDEERLHHGSVGTAVYLEYLKGAGGFAVASVVVGCFAVSNAILVLANLWLSHWSDHSAKQQSLLRASSLSSSSPSSGRSCPRSLLCSMFPSFSSCEAECMRDDALSVQTGFGVYVGLVLLHLIVAVGGLAVMVRSAQSAARFFHERLLRAVTDAQMSFFDTTPLGRVQNRFTRDLNVVDETLPQTLGTYANLWFKALATFTAIAFVFPLFILFLLPLLVFYRRVQNFYIPTSRQLQRVQSLLRSPIFQDFSETLDGVATIRAFRQQARFRAQSEEKMDAELEACYLYFASNRWLALRLEFVGTLVVTFTALCAVFAKASLQQLSSPFSPSSHSSPSSPFSLFSLFSAPLSSASLAASVGGLDAEGEAGLGQGGGASVDSAPFAAVEGALWGLLSFLSLGARMHAPQGLSPGLGGLAISYALNITQHLNWLVRMASETESNVLAVERIKEYADNIPSEHLEPRNAWRARTAMARGDGRACSPERQARNGEASFDGVCGRERNDRTEDDWPLEGRIVLKNLSARYHPDGPLVIKGINAEFGPGERIGLVGRTGAGKSTLLLTMLRMVEPATGSVFVDGVDTLDVPLRVLRSKFSIIPQDPVLFSGTIRFNVDALGRHTDEEIWSALERAHLASHILSLSSSPRSSSSSASSSTSSSHSSSASASSSSKAFFSSFEDSPQNGGGERVWGVCTPERGAAVDGYVPLEDREDEIWSLRKAALDMQVEENGQNFSMGQRQLLCLA
ncbi:ABC transporter transmembrane region domain-containing protein, partial [Toxoplasma gondii MAS]